MDPRWAADDDETLLATPLRRLRLKIAASPLRSRIERLHEELERKGIAFRPHVWFSTDWFSPDNVPGLTVPFYLGHERLAKLERKLHHHCEGWSESECMRLLRHEAGHAIDTAHGLARRRDWKELFGKRNAPYRRSYHARPGSSDFVRHLPRWYAQSHPAEDFAETFAVWLSRGTRGAPAGTLARTKLEYVAHLASELGRERPRGVLRERPYSLATNSERLVDHYARKRRERAREPEPAHGALLERWTTAGEPARSTEVVGELRRLEPDVRTLLGEHERYDVDQILLGMRHDAQRRGLRWRHARRRPRAQDVAEGVRAAWKRLQRGTAALPR